MIDVVEKREEALALFEEYKVLLTTTQRTLFSDYYLYDLSLSEIGENHGISRSAASESINKTLHKLADYEKKLHNVEFKKSLRKALADPTEDKAIKNIKELMENGL